MEDFARVEVLSRNVAHVSGPGEVFGVLSNPRPRPYSALFCNVHMLMLSREDEALRAAMESSDFVFPDGVPLAWLQSRLTGENAATIRGYQVMMHLCETAEARGQSIGLHGSTSSVLKQLRTRLLEWYPRLQIGWSHAPEFVQGELHESEDVLSAINRSGISHLFIALGCPKQEKWVARYGTKLDCNVLAVGAAFEWLAGVEPMANEWVEQHGLTWLQRWLHHPLRYFKRYGYYNTKFIFLALAELLRRRSS